MGKLIASGFEGGESIKRSPCEAKEFISVRGIACPANRKDLIRFAEGKQTDSDFLDLLKGYLK